MGMVSKSKLSGIDLKVNCKMIQKKTYMEHDIRPWGEYWVLEDANTHKVKRIQVNPRGRLSLQ